MKREGEKERERATGRRTRFLLDPSPPSSLNAARCGSVSHHNYHIIQVCVCGGPTAVVIATKGKRTAEH